MFTRAFASSSTSSIPRRQSETGDPPRPPAGHRTGGQPSPQHPGSPHAGESGVNHGQHPRPYSWCIAVQEQPGMEEKTGQM